MFDRAPETWKGGRMSEDVEKRRVSELSAGRPDVHESPSDNPGRCWVCGSERSEPWKTVRAIDALAPDDLRITDARYGLTLRLLQCAECGFRFASSSALDGLTSLYADLDDPEYEETGEVRRLQLGWLVDLARAELPSARSVLDVGAASGLLVSEAGRRGLEAIGVEPSRWLVERARSRLRVELLEGVLPRPELKDRRFDIVFLVDVIEHVSNPLDVLQRCVDHLAPGGVLLVVTPDAHSIAARLLGKRWWHYRLAHVGYFDRQTLTRAFLRVGLEAIAWRRARWVFPVRYMATRLESYLPVGWLNRLAESVGPIRWLYNRRVPLNLLDSYAVLVRHARTDSIPGA